MNADELDAAREAVSATRTWRDQMRADWGTNFREPEEVLDEAVGELLAERDRLRAVVEIANRVVDRRDPEQWSVDHNAFAELGVALDQLDAGPTGEDT